MKNDQHTYSVCMNFIYFWHMAAETEHKLPAFSSYQHQSTNEFTAALFPDSRCVCVLMLRVCFISCRNGQKSFSTWRPTSWCRTCPERRASKKRTSPDACTRGHMHTRTRKQSRTKCKSTVPKIDMKIWSASTRNVTRSKSHIRDLMYFTWTKMVKCYVKILRNHHVAFTPSPKHICAYIVHTLQSTTQPDFSHINGGSKNRRKQNYQNSWKYVYTSL